MSLSVDAGSLTAKPCKKNLTKYSRISVPHIKKKICIINYLFSHLFTENKTKIILVTKL
jgi:hypothetical protein